MSPRLLVYVIPMVLVWGSQAGVVRRALEGLPANVVVFYNLSAALVLLVPYLALTGRFRALSRHPAGTWLRLVITGLVGSWLYYVFLFHGLKIVGQDGVIEVNMMNYLFPIMSVIFSALILKERVTVIGAISIAISFSGAYVVLTHGNVWALKLADWQGPALGFLAAVCWGIFTALGRKWAPEPVSAIFVYFLTGWVLSVLMLPFASGPKIPTTQQLGFLLWAGMLSNCLGAILWFKALAVSNATLVGNLAYSAAFLSVFVINRLNGSPIRVSSLMGLCIIALGVILASRYGTGKSIIPAPSPSQ